jgi:hypothetical protein
VLLSDVIVQRMFTPNPTWTIAFEKNVLLLNAGADNLFAIQDVTEPVAQEIIFAWRKGAFKKQSLSQPAIIILEQLLTAGIVTHQSSKLQQKPFTVGISFVGDTSKEFGKLLKEDLIKKGISIVSHKAADFQLFVRTNGKLIDVQTDAYKKMTEPHLFIDIAYHHSFSIGPLVFPGDTACLVCLFGRINNYWGDAQPPIEPLMWQNVALVSSVAAIEIEKLASNDYSLINTTVTYDFQNHEIKKNSIYKLPWCPVCQKGDTLDKLGSIPLPWMKKS